MTKEKKKLILLGGLLGILAVVVISNGGSLWGRATAPTGRNASTTLLASQGAKRGEKAPAGQGREEGYRPLPLSALERVSTGSPEVRRNIFVYGPEAPPAESQGPPPPPPTLRVVGVNPTLLYARTGETAVRVTGEAFPPDVQIFLNGEPQPTQFVSPTELTTTIGRSFLARPGRLVLEVKDERGHFSGPREIPILEPPAPPYSYVGRIGDLVFLKKGDDRFAARIGELVDPKKDSRWRVASATDLNVILQDVVIRVNHRLDMDLGQTASTPSGTASPVDRMRGNRPRGVQPPLDQDNVINDEEELLQQQELLQEQLQQQLQMQQQMLLQQQMQQQLQQQPQPLQQMADPEANRLRQQLLRQRLQPWQRQQLEQQLLQQQLLQQEQLRRMRERPKE